MVIQFRLLLELPRSPWVGLIDWRCSCWLGPLLLWSDYMPVTVRGPGVPGLSGADLEEAAAGSGGGAFQMLSQVVP